MSHEQSKSGQPEPATPGRSVGPRRSAGWPTAGWAKSRSAALIFETKGPATPGLSSCLDVHFSRLGGFRFLIDETLSAISVRVASVFFSSQNAVAAGCWGPKLMVKLRTGASAIPASRRLQVQRRPLPQVPRRSRPRSHSRQASPRHSAKPPELTSSKLQRSSKRGLSFLLPARLTSYASSICCLAALMSA